MSRTIALLTDFGTRDTYVGAMKCVIASLAPRANVVDLTHDVPPHDVRAGAVALSSVQRYLPARVIVVAVVDPGVGTARKAIAARTADGATFVAPDNGLLTLVLRAEAPRRGEVLAVDHFGNAITNLPAAWVHRGDRVVVRGRTIAHVAATYGDVPVGRAVAVVSSGGTLEIAVSGGRAASRYRLAAGARVDLVAGAHRRRRTS